MQCITADMGSSCIQLSIHLHDTTHGLVQLHPGPGNAGGASRRCLEAGGSSSGTPPVAGSPVSRLITGGTKTFVAANALDLCPWVRAACCTCRGWPLQCAGHAQLPALQPVLCTRGTPGHQAKQIAPAPAYCSRGSRHALALLAQQQLLPAAAACVAHRGCCGRNAGHGPATHCICLLQGPRLPQGDPDECSRRHDMGA